MQNSKKIPAGGNFRAAGLWNFEKFYARLRFREANQAAAPAARSDQAPGSGTVWVSNTTVLGNVTPLRLLG